MFELGCLSRSQKMRVAIFMIMRPLCLTPPPFALRLFFLQWSTRWEKLGKFLPLTQSMGLFLCDCMIQKWGNLSNGGTIFLLSLLWATPPWKGCFPRRYSLLSTLSSFLPPSCCKNRFLSIFPNSLPSLGLS